MKLSILIPVYNEKNTIEKILKKVKKVHLKGIKKEIIIVDDNSNDGTKDILENFDLKNLLVLYNSSNHGKGYSIKKAIKHATGDIIIFQDADLEYNPEDYKKLIDCLLKNNQKVVYGSRFLKTNKKGNLSFYLGNRTLSLFTSFFYTSKITDMETCYKLFRKEVIKNLNLKSDDFAIEPEITAKILKRGIKIKEIPIDYHPRSFDKGKKIKWKDGFIALKTLVYYRFFN